MLHILFVFCFLFTFPAFAGKSRHRECQPILQQQQSPYYQEMERQRHRSNGGGAVYQDSHDDGPRTYDSNDGSVDGYGERQVDDQY